VLHQPDDGAEMRDERRLHFPAQQKYGEGKPGKVLSISGRTDGEPVATGKVLASEAGKNILEGAFPLRDNLGG
jgi:hypothetical protein